jgi:hypothetical protein
MALVDRFWGNMIHLQYIGIAIVLFTLIAATSLIILKGIGDERRKPEDKERDAGRDNI